jgi:hypothetical protein
MSTAVLADSAGVISAFDGHETAMEVLALCGQGALVSLNALLAVTDPEGVVAGGATTNTA